MAKKKGWKALPTSLKVLFVLLVLWTLFSLVSLGSVAELGYAFLGFQIYGITAIILHVLLAIIGMLVFLVALWWRLFWGWYFGLAYLAFFVVNGPLSLISLPERIEVMLTQLPVALPNLADTIYTNAVIGIVLGTIVNLVLLILLYKKKSFFFESKGKKDKNNQ